MRKSNEQTLGEVIAELLKTYGLDKKLAEQRLIDAWSGIVGEAVARHTSQLYIRDKCLHVKLDSSVVREELAYVKSGLLKKLNDEAGEKLIDEIVLR